VIGNNGHVAWGFTTTHGDTQDLYEEKLLPDDASQYETPNGPQKLEIRREIIKVKGAPDVALDIRSTRHGPIISDLDPDRYLKRDFALSWTGFDADDRTPEAFLAMNHAQDAAALKAALKDFNSPQQNVVYADTAGHIGFVAAGRVPVRRSIANESICPRRAGWRTMTGMAAWISRSCRNTRSAGRAHRHRQQRHPPIPLSLFHRPQLRPAHAPRPHRAVARPVEPFDDRRLRADPAGRCVDAAAPLREGASAGSVGLDPARYFCRAQRLGWPHGGRTAGAAHRCGLDLCRRAARSVR
jgi:hypothetical protein